MRNIFLVPVILFTLYDADPATAQSFAINTDGSTAHTSSILDVKSTVKGVLIPRITTTQRTSIASPAKGLLVFDSTANSFWLFDGAAWQEMVAGNNTLWKRNGNDIYNSNTGKVGVGINTPLALLHVREGAVLFDNTNGVTPVAGTGTRFMWIPAKAAFRAGYVANSQWDDVNIGINSVAFGISNMASGSNSFAIGESSSATATMAVVMGWNNVASGFSSTAMGLFSTANNFGSVAIGSNAVSSGNKAIAIGNSNRASADNAIAVGFSTKSKSFGGVTVGIFNDSANVASATTVHPLNRIFQIGNGQDDNFRSNAMTVLQNGNIGIGELVPGIPLNFASTLGDKLSLWGNTIANHYGLGIQSDLLQIHTNGSGADIAFGYGSSGSFTEKMRIKGSGNVGIGESNPTVPLNFASTLGNKISLWGNGNDHYGFGIQPNLLQIYSDVSVSDIAFGYGHSASFTERARIRGNGNVGIGLTNPARMLSVATDIAVDESDANNGTMANSLHFGPDYSGEAIASKRTNGGNKWGLDFYTNYLNRMVITYAGRVGIGVYSPDHLLSVASDIGVDAANGNSGSLVNSLHFGSVPTGEGIGSNRTGANNQWGLDFYTAGVNRFCISNSGNVGIGTTVPSTTLDVNGTTTTNGLQVGNGTVITKMQVGTIPAGSNAGSEKIITIPFPVAFATSTPRVFATARNATASNVNDAFAVTVRSVSATSVTLNIQRVDINGGWAQQLLVDWFAVE